MNCIGVALAGGLSRRMGRPKAGIEINGETLVTSTTERLGRVVDRVVVADRGQTLVAGLPSVADGSGRGPMAGVLGAAAAHPKATLLVLACDLPVVPVSLLQALRDLAGSDPRQGWVMPRWQGGVEPLVAVYRSAAIQFFSEQAKLGRYSLQRVTETAALGEASTEQAPNEPVSGTFLEGRALDAAVESLVVGGSGSAGPSRKLETVFRNLNTPSDLEEYLASLA